ncbi:hypothetical protein ABZ840_00150 [Streptomyces sp. NPDC047117]|uniref:hypothetical protein n=1 Tax=Streptomyces sp. NPDC047117 TaxID=3155379 RepID=UPI0033DAAFCB
MRGFLPEEHSSFVGRDKELALVRDLVRVGRLTTITGMGGCGQIAHTYLEQVLAHSLRQRCVEEGELWTRAYLSFQLALIALLKDEPGEAADHARAMLVGKRGLGDSFGVALGLDLLAAALAAQERGEEAAFVSGTGEAFWRSTGHPQRGMPELGAMREECERAARAAAGDHHYEQAFDQGRAGDAPA